jgi:hypothetical protein
MNSFNEGQNSASWPSYMLLFYVDVVDDDDDVMVVKQKRMAELAWCKINKKTASMFTCTFNRLRTKE